MQAKREKYAARKELGAQTVARAVTGQSIANYTAIIEGFIEKGIPANDISPRENIFTYNAWIALGRQVRKGEKGVKGTTWVEIKKGDEVTGKRPKSFTVFHKSQTDEVSV